MAKRKFKSVKRFGARYGTTIKLRLGKIEQDQRRLHKCPYCNSLKVKRIFLGAWKCRKCEAKFTGRAYTVAQKKR